MTEGGDSRRNGAGLMRESFRAFGEGLIDYAGIFPPAGLPLPEALQNYLRYREESEAWMLGRFVCPAERLGEIAVPIRVSALGRVTAAGSFEASIRTDLEAIGRFHDRVGASGRVVALEIRLPEGAEPIPVPGFRVFYEAPSADAVERTIEAIARRRSSAGDGGMGGTIPARDGAVDTIHARNDEGIGFKLRCGGVHADAFPSADRIARALAACRKAGVPFKATAGLHHPVRGYRAEVGTKMHGFVNLFGALLLGYANDLDEDQLRAILDEEDAGAFRFTDEAFSWRDVRIETERIRFLRRETVTSFGSCSFDEPRTDLRTLGLIESS